MAKFKPVRKKGKSTGTRPQGGLPCVILVFTALAMVAFLLYFVMKSS